MEERPGEAGPLPAGPPSTSPRCPLRRLRGAGPPCSTFSMWYRPNAIQHRRPTCLQVTPGHVTMHLPNPRGCRLPVFHQETSPERTSAQRFPVNAGFLPGGRGPFTACPWLLMKRHRGAVCGQPGPEQYRVVRLRSCVPSATAEGKVEPVPRGHRPALGSVQGWARTQRCSLRRLWECPPHMERTPHGVGNRTSPVNSQGPGSHGPARVPVHTPRTQLAKPGDTGGGAALGSPGADGPGWPVRGAAASICVPGSKPRPRGT